MSSTLLFKHYVISAEGLRPQEKTVAAIKEAPGPSNTDKYRAEGLCRFDKLLRKVYSRPFN